MNMSMVDWVESILISINIQALCFKNNIIVPIIMLNNNDSILARLSPFLLLLSAWSVSSTFSVRTICFLLQDLQ